MPRLGDNICDDRLGKQVSLEADLGNGTGEALTGLSSHVSKVKEALRDQQTTDRRVAAETDRQTDRQADRQTDHSQQRDGKAKLSSYTNKCGC